MHTAYTFTKGILVMTITLSPVDLELGGMCNIHIPINNNTVEPAMSSHPCDTIKVAFQDRWLLIGGSFVYKMSFWVMTKWPPIGGWLLIKVAALSRLYCNHKHNFFSVVAH